MAPIKYHRGKCFGFEPPLKSAFLPTAMAKLSGEIPGESYLDVVESVSSLAEFLGRPFAS